MTTLSSGCRRSCTTIAVEVSLIVGILAAILRYTSVIFASTTLLLTILGISVGFLAIMLVASVFDRCPGLYNNCICRALTALLIGILGAILLSLVLLAITVTVSGLLGAILIGALLFFFSLTLTATACLIICITRCGD